MGSNTPFGCVCAAYLILVWMFVYVSYFRLALFIFLVAVMKGRQK